MRHVYALHMDSVNNPWVITGQNSQPLFPLVQSILLLALSERKPACNIPKGWHTPGTLI